MKPVAVVNPVGRVVKVSETRPSTKMSAPRSVGSVPPSTADARRFWSLITPGLPVDPAATTKRPWVFTSASTTAGLAEPLAQMSSAPEACVPRSLAATLILEAS